MATAVHAAGSARLFGLSPSLAYAQGTMFFIRAEGLIPDARIGVVDCRVRLIRRLLRPLIYRRLLVCPPVEVFGNGFIYFTRFAGRHGCAASKVPIDKIKSA